VGLCVADTHRGATRKTLGGPSLKSILTVYNRLTWQNVTRPPCRSLNDSWHRVITSTRHAASTSAVWSSPFRLQTPNNSSCAISLLCVHLIYRDICSVPDTSRVSSASTANLLIALLSLKRQVTICRSTVPMILHCLSTISWHK